MTRTKKLAVAGAFGLAALTTVAPVADAQTRCPNWWTHLAVDEDDPAQVAADRNDNDVICYRYVGDKPGFATEPRYVDDIKEQPTP